MMANNMIITRYPKVILYTKTEHFGIILFELCNEQTNKPTTDGPKRPTHADRQSQHG